MMRSVSVALAVLGLAAAPLAAQTGGTTLVPDDDTEATRVATRGAAFLNLPVGARAQALSGAYTAIASGIPALYWNTAAIAFDEGTHIGASITNFYEDLDIQQVFAGITLPFGAGRVGVSINQLSSGEIVRTTEAFPDGGDPQFGATFEWTGTAVGLHYARMITDRLAVGVAGKYITEGIPGARAQFVAADLAIQFETGLLGTRLAAALVNIGSSGRLEGSLLRRQVDQTEPGSNLFPVRRILPANFGTSDVELPTGFRFGLSTDLFGGVTSLIGPSPDHRLIAMVDVTDRTDSPLAPTVGMEYSYRGLVFLRGGKQWANEAQISRDFSHLLSVGGGVSLPLPGNRRIVLDYAYTSMQDLENVQSFAVELAF